MVWLNLSEDDTGRLMLLVPLMTGRTVRPVPRLLLYQLALPELKDK